MGGYHCVWCLSNASVDGLPKAVDCHRSHGSFSGRMVVRTPFETNERSIERLTQKAWPEIKKLIRNDF